MHIIRDLRSGALPLAELPAFLIWCAGKLFWPLVGGTAVLLFLFFISH